MSHYIGQRKFSVKWGSRKLYLCELNAILLDLQVYWASTSVLISFGWSKRSLIPTHRREVSGWNKTCHHCSSSAQRILGSSHDRFLGRLCCAWASASFRTLGSRADFLLLPLQNGLVGSSLGTCEGLHCRILMNLSVEDPLWCLKDEESFWTRARIGCSHWCHPFYARTFWSPCTIQVSLEHSSLHDGSLLRL